MDINSVLDVITVFSIIAIGFYYVGNLGHIIKNLINKESIIEELKCFNLYHMIIYNNKNSNDSDVQFTKKVALGLTIFCAIGVINAVIPYTDLAPREIGAIMEEKTYTTYNYVYLYPENSKDKNYKVLAKINADNRKYYINKVIFSNGEILELDDSGLSGDIDKSALYKPIYIRDRKGEDWRIK